MKIFVLGCTGVVGHMVAAYFREAGYELRCVDNEVAYDTNHLKAMIDDFRADAIINCTAIVNQAAENDKNRASYINAYLPHFLESITSDTSTVVVHRSTDCIFSGLRGQYTLDDWPDAQSFYARTKAVGELVNDKDITIRVSLIGPAQEPDDGSLLNWFLHQQGRVNGFANSIWTGLTTLEYAKTIENLLLLHAHGLFQAAPVEELSKYDLLCLFEKHFPGHREIVRIDNNRVDKSLVPFWGPYDIRISSYEEQIIQLKRWIKRHPSLYPAYYNEIKK